MKEVEEKKIFLFSTNIFILYILILIFILYINRKNHGYKKNIDLFLLLCKPAFILHFLHTFMVSLSMFCLKLFPYE